MSDAEAKVAAIENDMVETAKQIDTLTAKRTSYHQKYLNYIVKFLI